MNKPIQKSLALSLLMGLFVVQGNLLLANAQALPPLTQPGQYTYGQQPQQPNATSIYQPETVFPLRGRVSTVPQGTLMMIRLDQPVNSSTAKMGEVVTATVESPIFVNDTVAIPAGSQIIGHVASVDAPGHVGKHGSLDIRFDAIKAGDYNSNPIPIRAHIDNGAKDGVLKGDTYTKDVIKGVGIAGAGAGVGTLAGLSAGSLIGSAGAGAVFGLGVGALGGIGYAMLRKGKDVQIPSGSRMSVTLDQPVTVNL